jgi:hypothetical protein
MRARNEPWEQQCLVPEVCGGSDLCCNCSVDGHWHGDCGLPEFKLAFECLKRRLEEHRQEPAAKRNWLELYTLLRDTHERWWKEDMRARALEQTLAEMRKTWFSPGYAANAHAGLLKQTAQLEDAEMLLGKVCQAIAGKDGLFPTYQLIVQYFTRYVEGLIK